MWVRKEVEVCTVFNDKGSSLVSCVLDVNRNFFITCSDMRFTFDPVSSKKRKTFLLGKAFTKIVGKMWFEVSCDELKHTTLFQFLNLPV